MLPDVCVFDCDGTICYSGSSNLPRQTIELLEELKKNCILILATGRPELLLPISCNNIWDAEVIYNGQLFKVNRNAVFRCTLLRSDVLGFCDALKRAGKEYILFSQEVFSPVMISNIPLKS